MLRIMDFKIKQSYTIWLEFSDGISGDICVKDLVGKGVFKCWENYETFKKAKKDPITGTLMWKDKNSTIIDLDPYKLHDDIKTSN